MNWGFWQHRFVVYRLYDGAGRLMYIGSTNHLPRRMKEHVGWWREHIARVRIQVLPTLEAARAAEKAAIRDEQPLINVISTGRAATDKTWPGWTRLDHARAEEFRTRQPSAAMRDRRRAAMTELQAALAELP